MHEDVAVEEHTTVAADENAHQRLTANGGSRLGVDGCTVFLHVLGNDGTVSLVKCAVLRVMSDVAVDGVVNQLELVGQSEVLELIAVQLDGLHLATSSRHGLRIVEHKVDAEQIRQLDTLLVIVVEHDVGIDTCILHAKSLLRGVPYVNLFGVTSQIGAVFVILTKAFAQLRIVLRPDDSLRPYALRINHSIVRSDGLRLVVSNLSVHLQSDDVVILGIICVAIGGGVSNLLLSIGAGTVVSLGGNVVVGQVLRLSHLQTDGQHAIAHAVDLALRGIAVVLCSLDSTIIASSRTSHHLSIATAPAQNVAVSGGCFRGIQVISDGPHGTIVFLCRSGGAVPVIQASVGSVVVATAHGLLVVLIEHSVRSVTLAGQHQVVQLDDGGVNEVGILNSLNTVNEEVTL